MAWPKATDGVGPMREHQAHIRAEMQARRPGLDSALCPSGTPHPKHVASLWPGRPLGLRTTQCKHSPI